jgi:hypothetical protein
MDKNYWDEARKFNGGIPMYRILNAVCLAESLEAQLIAAYHELSELVPVQQMHDFLMNSAAYMEYDRYKRHALYEGLGFSCLSNLISLDCWDKKLQREPYNTDFDLALGVKAVNLLELAKQHNYLTIEVITKGGDKLRKRLGAEKFVKLYYSVKGIMSNPAYVHECVQNNVFRIMAMEYVENHSNFEGYN